MTSSSPSFDAIAFAGGGNRCYWQGGFWEAFTARCPQAPRFVVGVSAGAFQAAFNMIGLGAKVRPLVIDACSPSRRETDWSLLRQGKSPFVVGGMYRDLLTETFGPADLAALKQAPELLIQIAHPPDWMPAPLAVIGAIGAYQIEKAITRSAHSKAGLYLGLKPAWVSTHDMNDAAELIDALMATASVPPFMPVGRINGRNALDGGLVDNPPLQKMVEVEAKGGRTLVLSTRSGRPLSDNPQRVIVRPSQPVTVNKFSVTDGAGIRAAYELGVRDGEAFAAEWVATAPKA